MARIFGTTLVAGRILGCGVDDAGYFLARRENAGRV